MIYAIYVLAYLCLGWILSFLWARFPHKWHTHTTGQPTTPGDVASMMLLWPVAVLLLSLYLIFNLVSDVGMWILTLPIPKETRSDV